jgi:O-methyltransferase involved in polyketide biosynthesis
MAKGYRTWEERRQIISSIIAESNPPPVTFFDLSDSEETYFRARSTKAVHRLAKSSATFKAYYAIPTKKPYTG